ncbi:hypothetical protein G6F66_015170 [Rhizopus arrhizus]|nr:hypothetical protein G6F66_015170 [Rhizopus arrhizus]
MRLARADTAAQNDAAASPVDIGKFAGVGAHQVLRSLSARVRGMERVDMAIREPFGNRRTPQLGKLEGLGLLPQQRGLLAAGVALRTLRQPLRGLQRLILTVDAALPHVSFETKTGHLPKSRHGSLAH